MLNRGVTMIKYLLTAAMVYLSLTKLAMPAEVLTFWGDDQNLPVSYRNEYGEIVGIDVDVLREVASRAGFQVQIKLAPWKRVLNSLEKGRIDGAFPLAKTARREEYGIYTEVPVHSYVFSAYTKSKFEFSYTNLNDLSNKHIGVQLGFSISDEFDRAAKNGALDVHEVASLEQLVKLTLKDRLDILIAKPSHMSIHLAKSGLKLSEIGTVSERAYAYIVLSKKAKISNKNELIDKINHAMKAMRDEGAMKKIMDKYIPNAGLSK